jgi:ABC-type branched-subunit amino acid transport system substrate-binding protein
VFVPFAAALVVALSAAGCSSSGSGGTSNPATGGGGSGASTAGDIKFMSTAAVDSPIGSYPEVETGAQAAADAINSAGGINGHKIELTFCNSKGDVNQAMTCARQAVSGHDVAVIGQTDFFDPQTMPILENAGIPDIGVYSGGATIDGTSPISFPLNAGNFGAYSALPYAYKSEGDKTVGLLAIDLPITLNFSAVVAKAAAAAGIKTVGPVEVPEQGVSDYTPYAQQLKSLDADGVVAMVGASQFDPIVQAAGSIGLDAQFGVCSTCDQTGEDILLSSAYPLVTDTSNPGIAEYNKELKADGKPVASATDVDAYPGLNAWAAMHAAADVAKGISGTVTAASMVAALHDARNVNVENLLTWNPADLGSDSLGKFPRFPKTDYYIFVMKNNKIADAGVPAVKDPISAAR